MNEVCVIVPTKNRPDALALAVRSVLAQTVAPLSLVIVDQSPDGESRRRVEAELSAATERRGPLCYLNYIHDPAIAGAASARNRAMAAAASDIWLFLDDDVCLEPDFVEQLLAVYRDHPEVAGVSGIITNQRRPLLAFRLWSGLFMRGPFHDERQPIYWNAERLRDSPPLRVHRFGGGLMSFRAEAIHGNRFDENLDRSMSGVSDGEDVDFCSRLAPDAVLLIAPRARLQHYHSPNGRLTDHWLRREARGNLFLYHKHWNRSWRNRLSCGWLWVGYSVVAIEASCRRLSLEPWRALRLGAREAANATPVTPSAGESANGSKRPSAG
jgi:GT2 family glycosyltransferase